MLSAGSHWLSADSELMSLREKKRATFWNSSRRRCVTLGPTSDYCSGRRRELAPKAAVNQRPSLAQGKVVLKYAKVGRLSVDLVVSCR